MKTLYFKLFGCGEVYHKDHSAHLPTMGHRLWITKHPDRMLHIVLGVVKIPDTNEEYIVYLEQTTISK